MGVSINLHPQPHLPSPCIRTIKMRGCSKIAWMDAIRTTRYPLLSWCIAVILSKEFPVTKIYSGFNQVSYCMQKIFLQLFTRLQSIDMNGMSPNPFTWRWQLFFLAKEKRTRNFLFAYVNVHISYKMMHRRNAWRIGTNWPWNKFFGRCFNRKEKTPLLLWVCWLKKFGIMICFHLLSCRWFYETFALVKGETP